MACCDDGCVCERASETVALNLIIAALVALAANNFSEIVAYRLHFLSMHRDKGAGVATRPLAGQFSAVKMPWKWAFCCAGYVRRAALVCELAERGDVASLGRDQFEVIFPI